MLLGADGLDEEEEQAAAAAAAIGVGPQQGRATVTGGQLLYSGGTPPSAGAPGSAAAAATMLDPYLQPPEVHVAARRGGDAARGRGQASGTFCVEGIPEPGKRGGFERRV